MKITVDGKDIVFTQTLTLTEVLAKLPPPNGPFAVSLNRDFVPRSQYCHLCLKDGDELDLVVPMQGG